MRSSGLARDSIEATGPAVQVHELTKAYGQVSSTRSLSALAPWGSGPAREGPRALDNVTFTVQSGEALGIIGPNGAGKSTVLRVIAGVTRPDSGFAQARGTVGSIIEFGVGFHEQLTGRENLRCAAALSWTGTVTQDEEDEIIEFAELEDSIDLPIRQYSLGMQARLAFAVATCRRPDVLLVDEVLAVGDRDFQLRCMARINEMRLEGTALLFVSHSMHLVALMCDRALHLDAGAVVEIGPAIGVVERYKTNAPSDFLPQVDRFATIESIRVQPTVQPLESIEIEVDINVRRPTDSPRIGVELLAPTIQPGAVIATSIVEMPDLVATGRHTLIGRSDPIGFENALLRLRASVLDGNRISDIASGDSRLLGGAIRGRPAALVLPSFTLLDTRTDPRRYGGISPAANPLDAVIAADGLTKRYWSRRAGSARAMVSRRVRTDTPGVRVALNGLELAVSDGEAVGVIGPNGSGKSTLLRVLAGMTKPDEGTCEVRGSVVPMLGLAVAFHPELTGRDNLRTAATFFGLGREPSASVLAAAEAFSGLGPALDNLVRTYSSGMLARLSLSLAVNTPGEILLIDEMLASGDIEFREAVIDAVRKRVDAGASLIFVSHELSMVETMCDRVACLRAGRVTDDGPASEVIDSYGGLSWAGGTFDATSGVRLLPITPKNRSVPVGATLAVEGAIIVDEPIDTARLEVSYRNTPESRAALLTNDDREQMSFYTGVLVPAGEILASPGVHHYRVEVGRNLFAGAFDFVVSVVDEVTNSVLSEAWHQVQVGHDRPEGFPGPVLNFEWVVRSQSGTE